MDRIIEVKVNGSYITKDNRNAGVQHEANSTSLRIRFDPGWDSYAKKITWWNAKGENPVEIILGVNLLEDAGKDTRVYLCPIPGEPLAECGECTFVIDGYVDGKRQRSAADRLWVKEAPFKENAGQPSDPTPSQAEQLQKEIDGIKGTISQAVASRDAAAESAAQAKDSETAAASSASAAAKSETAAAGSAASAAADASAAAKSAGAAAQSEQNAKASETAAKSSETMASSAASSAAQAKTAAESAQKAAETAQGKAESAQTAAEAAQGKAEQGATAAEAAKSAAESSKTAAAASEKTAESWAVGGTGTRVGEDTNNAKYWSERASAIVGGDFATKAEARGYVADHNQSSTAHADLRQAIAGKENAGAAAAVQRNLTAHMGDTVKHVTAEERTKWNAKEEGGAAAAVQQNLTAHMGDTVKHVTAAERTAWNGKADLVNGKVPSSQLPATEGFTKEETLKDATAALYGLGIGAVPDDVLEELGKYKQYWWRRRLSAGERYVEVQNDISAYVELLSPNVNTSAVIYSKSLVIDQTSGSASLGDALTLPTTSGQALAEAIVANAPLYVSVSGTIYCVPDGATAGSGSNPAFNTATIMYYTSSNKPYVHINGSGNPIGKAVTTTKKISPAGDWQYLQSSDRSAYPDSGEVPISSTWVEHRENNSDTLLEYNQSYSYATEISIDQATGEVSLVSPQTTTATNASSEMSFIKSKAPCYLKTSYDPSKIYYVPAGATSGTSYTYTLQGNGFPVQFGSSGNPHGMVVTAVQKTISYEYEYLGIPFDNAVTAPKIETGSYVGTGTYGSANPNRLTFGFAPQLVILPHVSDYNGCPEHVMFYVGTRFYKIANGITGTLEGRELSWYSENSISEQFNKPGTTYYYFAIG